VRAVMLDLTRRARLVGALVIGLLRELGDESAYARFLAAHGRQASPDAWRQFSDERLRAKYTRPKCC
jgi:hypothetical protein